MNTTDWLGFFGVSLILIAYFLNEIGKITNKNISFILLNLIGASVACLASVLLKYLPFIILEGIWTLISIQSLIKFIQKKKLPKNC